MRCEEVKPRLAELSAEALAPREAAGVRAHLEGCARCREEMELLTRALSLLSLAPRPEPPAELWAGVEARIRGLRRPRPLLLRWSTAAAVAALLLAVIGGLWWRGRLPSIQPEVSYVRLAPGPGFLSGRHQVDPYLRQHLDLASYQPFADRAGLFFETAAFEGGR